MRTSPSCLVLGFAILSVPFFAPAQEPGPSPAPAAPSRPVWVRPFGVTIQESGRPGPLGKVRDKSRERKAADAAKKLAEEIARDFEEAGYSARFLATDAPLPREGWLVRGAWYAMDAGGGIVHLPHFLGGQDPLNVDLSVSVADLAVDPGSPFVVFGKAEALRGQGPPVGWSPLVIGAKFVAHKVRSGADCDAIAKEVVDTILKSRAEIAEKAGAEASKP